MSSNLDIAPPSYRGILKYSIRNRADRVLLSSHLTQAVTLSLAKTPQNFKELLYQELYLKEAISLLAKESDGTLLVRQAPIQKSLYSLFELLEEIRTAPTLNPRSTDRRLAKAVAKFVDKLNKLTNVRVKKYKEVWRLEQINADFSEKVFYLNLIRIPAAFHPIFEGRYYQTPTMQHDLTAGQIRDALLQQFEPELAAAYSETERLRYKASTLTKGVEDEYFVEQITKDYYPHLFGALHNVIHDSAAWKHRDEVVAESFEQFKLIQQGLQKIIDTTTANNMNSMKSQTEFLRSKVLGSSSLPLLPLIEE